MSKLQYQGDALWGACPDGGDVEFVDGEPIRSGGLSGAIYISMFGGNYLDDGVPGSNLQWWGNHLEADETRHIRGRTGTLVAGLPMVSANLLRVEEAGRQDCQWMLDIGVASELTVEASIQSAQFLCITVTVTALDQTETFEFRENWASGPFEPPALACAA